ncbi:hypothetical protein [Streptomyces gobitricini]|uniref:Uncharacterized protein n=1 Tax=Streptomyces gobitricini TaxID=68211 RepID=A0ABN3LF03_9ACTN
MTQSGQGPEPHLPAARPAHEGVVLPAEGGEAWGAAGAGPAGGAPWGGPWGPSHGQQQSPQHHQQPGAYDQQPGAYQQQDEQQHQQYQQHEGRQHHQYGQPEAYQQHHQYGHQEHQQQQYQAQAPRQQYPQEREQGQDRQEQTYGAGAQPLPPEVPSGGGDADATQYLPPVAAPGAGPMPLPAENPAESTRFLGARPAAAQDTDATQYLPPVPPQPSGAPFGIRPGAPGDRQPPAEFDSLFRDDAAATRHMPPVGAQAPRPQAQQPYQAPHTPQASQPVQQQYQEPAPRRSSKLPLIAAVVVGCAVLGLGAGALLSGGEEAPKGTTDKAGVAAASSPTPGVGAPQAAPDPARTQAEALDKLLADSNNSRDTVIRSVENIKKCQNLDRAADDLRGAAGQRRDLVTRLQGLTVDKLPDHARLSAALTKAWQASASADDHYAAWADQVKGKKGCKDGKARSTDELAEGNRASGEATAAKKKASELWNGIAATHGLSPRQPAQL